MTGLVALALVVGLSTGAVGKGSFVKITTRSGKVVLGVVVDEMPAGLGIQNGNQREIVPFADIADVTELSDAAPVEPLPPPPMPPPVVPPEPAYVAPPPVVEQPEPPPPPPPPDPPSSVAVRANLADIGFFGPTLGGEIALVGKLGVLFEGRVLNGGAMMQLGGPYGIANFGNVPGRYALRLDMGGGGSAGVIWFLGSRKGLRGFYLSVALETLYRETRLGNDTSFFSSSRGTWIRAAIGQWFLTPHARIGFRWRAGPMLIGLGVRGGAGILTTSNITYPSRVTLNWGSSQMVYPDVSAILDLGFYVR